MADWFQIDSNLPQKPEVRQIRRSTREEKSTIVGRLVMFWALVDQHGDLIDEHERPAGTDFDGLIPGYTIEDLEDEIGGDRDFWDAVCDTGWLREDAQGLLMPGFERRFETNAKRRAEASRRKRRQRNRDSGVTGSSTKTSRKSAELPDDRRRVTNVTTSRDICVTRGEERRREEKRREEIPSPSEDLTSAPSPAATGERRRGSGEGNDLFWQKLCDQSGSGALRQAVKQRSTEFFRRAWSEAAAAGWVTETDRDTRRRFLAACWYVINPPDGYTIESPARVLRHKLCEHQRGSPDAWKTGNNATGLDDDFARQIERQLDGVATLPRTASLQPQQRSAADEIAKLQALAGAR